MRPYLTMLAPKLLEVTPPHTAALLAQRSKGVFVPCDFQKMFEARCFSCYLKAVPKLHKAFGERQALFDRLGFKIPICLGRFLGCEIY